MEIILVREKQGSVPLRRS